MRAALLESLFFDTPCGSIVLWRPPPGEPTRTGVPLGRGADRVEHPHFIVDGQQRIRSLLAMRQVIELLRDPHTAAAVDEEPDGRRWRLNVARLMPGSGLPGSRELPLFLRLGDRSTIPGSQFTIPAARVVGGDWDTWIDKSLRSDLRPLAAERLREAQVRVQAIPERRLFVRVLDGHSFSDVVGIYNRINSAGKRVEAEERALASLSAYDRETHTRLRILFEGVHLPENEAADSEDALLRDETLQRKRERALGLKFMIRVFVQAGAFHLGLSVKASSLDLGLMDRWTFRQAMSRDDGPRLLEIVWSDATRVASCIARVLRSLGCEDFRFVPDAASLVPIAQLLIRFPALADAKYEALLQAVVLKTFLEAPRDLLAVADEIRTTEVTTDMPLARYIRERFLHGGALDLTSRLENSNSLQDRYLLLLAWMLKRNRAQDFSVENLEESEMRTFKSALETSYGAVWEKQHIVPFAHAPERGTRSRGPATNIGNMTFISSALNWALKDKPISLKDEDPSNLGAHFLSVDMAADLRISMDKGVPVPERKAAFEKICRKRRQLISEGFAEWMADLEAAAMEIDLEGLAESTPFVRRSEPPA